MCVATVSGLNVEQISHASVNLCSCIAQIENTNHLTQCVCHFHFIKSNNHKLPSLLDQFFINLRMNANCTSHSVDVIPQYTQMEE